MRTRSIRAAVVLAAGSMVLAGALGAVTPNPASAAAVEQLPDLQTIIPTDTFSIVGTGAAREFRYTHLIFDAGPGPLEIQPSYDAVSGGYRGMQQMFGKDPGTGAWSETREVRVPDTFIYHAEHGHFHFPLASFGLYQVAAGGGIGAPVAISPKNGFCIDDSYAWGDQSKIPNAGVFIGDRSACTDPTGLRGITVGRADEYDYRDPGQAVPINGVPDGTYWFKAVTDPYNDFIETNEANNETDVKVTIAASGNGWTVTPSTVVTPDTTPPRGTLTAPREGQVVRGTTTLTATSPTAGVRRVDFLVDGEVVGSSTTAPYAYSWDTTGTVDGTHWMAARITDAQDRTGTTPVSAVTVGNAGVGGGNLALVGSVSSDGSGVLTSAALTSIQTDDVLVALVASDGPETGQRMTVSGGGLSWRLVARSNGQPGTSEVWTATAPAAMASVQATSSPTSGTPSQSISVLAFRGAAGVGVSAVANARTGAPSVRLPSTTAGSLTYAVGNDWDGATARTIPSGQSIVHQWVASAVGDTFWSQTQTQPAGGGAVVLNATAPTTHRWNLAAVEVVPAAGGPDTSAPRVSITDPGAGATLDGPVRVAATAGDNIGVTSVTFTVDGTPVGTSSTPPFVIEWDSATVGKGTHTIQATATDAAGNVGTSAPVSVTVDNSGPPPTPIVVDVMRTTTGKTTVLTPVPFTSQPGELLIAYVGFDGPVGSAQTARVAGGGLVWTLVKRSNTHTGTAEIWSARATRAVKGLRVTASAGVTGYDGVLTVAAYQGAAGTGVASAASATTGAASIYLPGTGRGSWGFAIGTDGDAASARTVAADQTLHQQWVNTTGRNTFWLQSMAVPNRSTGLDTLSTTAPSDRGWNVCAVEIRATRG